MALDLHALQKTVALGHARMARIEAELNAADAVLGDGDTGSMLARVMERMAAVDLSRCPDLGTAFAELAKATLFATGSSLGTLLATALLSFSKASSGQESVTSARLAEMLEQAIVAMMQRGKASLGDKTILDSAKAIAARLAASEIGMAAAAAAGAHAALEQFLPAPCKVGRARMFPEKSRGAHDPGMLALWLLLKPEPGAEVPAHRSP